MRRLILSLFILSYCFPVMAQEDMNVMHVLEFMGAEDVSEVDADEVERLARYLSRPLRLNGNRYQAIRESGLLTRYQIASLENYRNNHGDIMSLLELASVDGFNESFVTRLAPFITLESTSDPAKARLSGYRSSHEMTLHEMTLGVSKVSSGIRYKVNHKAGIDVSVAAVKSYDTEGLLPDNYAAGVSWQMNRLPLKVIAGDFNARFGQGLALWNGMNISGLTSPSSFARRPTGVTLSSSYKGTSSFTGAAAEFQCRNFVMSVMAAVPGIKTNDKASISILPAVNITRLTDSGQYGITHYAEFNGLNDNQSLRIPDMKTSADMTFCFRGIDVYAESTYDWISKAVASLAGVTFPSGELLKFSAMARYYPYRYVPSRSGAARSTTRCSNEHGVTVATEAVGGQWIQLNGSDGFGNSVRKFAGVLSLDAAFFPVAKAKGFKHSLQIKLFSDFKCVISPSLQMKVRLTERIRSWGLPFRTDFRTDLNWFSSRYDASLRVNLLSSDKTGFMTYSECCMKYLKFKMYIRVGVFIVDDWDDRIYVYERDVNGTFNVPALYGRGLWVSSTAAWRLSVSQRLQARVSFTSYGLMAEKKPGKAELKLQYIVKF